MQAIHTKKRSRLSFETASFSLRCKVNLHFCFSNFLIENLLNCLQHCRKNNDLTCFNDQGEILDFMPTHGNVCDREPLKQKSLHDKIFRKLFGDKGYIGKTLFEQLLIDGIHLVTKLIIEHEKLLDAH